MARPETPSGDPRWRRSPLPARQSDQRSRSSAVPAARAGGAARPSGKCQLPAERRGRQYPRRGLGGWEGGEEEGERGGWNTAPGPSPHLCPREAPSRSGHRHPGALGVLRRPPADLPLFSSVARHRHRRHLHSAVSPGPPLSNYKDFSATSGSSFAVFVSSKALESHGAIHPLCTLSCGEIYQDFSG